MSDYVLGFHEIDRTQVEIVGGNGTDARVLDWAEAFYRGIGREPIRLKREVYGHVANRLQYVLFNEAARLVFEGVATVRDIDARLRGDPGCAGLCSVRS